VRIKTLAKQRQYTVMIARSLVILLNCRTRVSKPQVIGTEKRVGIQRLIGKERG
jgi:hypothetical protein